MFLRTEQKQKRVRRKKCNLLERISSFIENVQAKGCSIKGLETDL